MLKLYGQAGRWALAVGICLAPLSVPRAHDRISTSVTWDREIGPLVERRCASCHTHEGFAFPLTSYEQARPWAVAIKEVTLAGEMPPWGAAPGVGHFANDRRLTRHEIELIAAWVDGGAPSRPRNTREAGSQGVNPQDANAELTPPAVKEIIADPAAFDSERVNSRGNPKGAAGQFETFVPLANAVISEATQRTASVTVGVPAGLSLTAWTFEPGEASLVDRVDLELATRWLGTWTPGERAIEFPADAGVALGASALFTARISYREPRERVIDYSGIRIWTTKDPRPKTVRETTIVRSWRTANAVELLALRPTGAAGVAVEAMARFASGRVEPLGLFAVPARAPHPIYRLARPLALPAGSRVDVTGPVRVLYADGATRTVKPNVRRRPRR
jgi:mono/diheme cytochrome c family protein